MNDTDVIANVIVKNVDGETVYQAPIVANSVGVKRCGVGFNPTESPKVAKIKLLSAALMQEISDTQEQAGPGDSRRCFFTAMTHLEAAQMFAVKGLFQ